MRRTSLHHVIQAQRIDDSPMNLQLSCLSENGNNAIWHVFGKASETNRSSFKSHELKGICSSPRLNVVVVTQAKRLMFPVILSDW